MLIPLPEYEWLNDILIDDAAKVTLTLENCNDNEAEKSWLLGRQFQFFDPKSIENDSARNFKLTSPFLLAAVHGISASLRGNDKAWRRPENN